MIYSESRLQWEHSKEAEAFGVEIKPEDMPPSLRQQFTRLRSDLTTANREWDEARAELEEARGLLAIATDGGMTDYTEAPNGPVCGFCGYEVEDCQTDATRDADYTGPTPCPGIKARALLARATPATTKKGSDAPAPGKEGT